MISTLRCGRALDPMRNGWTSICVVQARSISSAESKPIQLNPNMSYRPAIGNLDNKDRPLVLMYGWLGAKAKHIHKYGDFYLGKGFDVLHVKIKPLQIVQPLKAQGLVSKVLDFLLDNEHSTKPLLVHAFSVGGYMCGETYVKLTSQPEKYSTVSNRLQGQIVDSGADLESLPYGFSTAVTSIRPLQKLLQASLEGYLNTFEQSATRHYRASSKALHTNPLELPTLFLYSGVDPVGAPGPIETMVSNWEKNSPNISWFTKDFVDSRHVSHFQKYPVEYIGQLNMFLDFIKLGRAEEYRRRIQQDG